MGDVVLVTVVAGGVAAVVLVAVVAAVWGLEQGWPAMRRLMLKFTDLLGPLSFSSCLLLAGASGVAEELVFRACLQPEIGLAWTTIIFAILHFPFERDLLLWPIFALGAGLLFGGLFERNQCALAPISAHFVINLVHLLRVSRAAGRSRCSVM